MTIHLKHTLLLAGLLAGATSLAHAADRDTPYLGMMGTYLFPDISRKLDNGYGATALFGFPINDYVVPELTLSGVTANRKPASAGSDRLYSGGLNFAVFPFGRDNTASPFLLLGGGGEREDHLTGRKTSGYADAGGGLLISLNRSRTAAIRIEGGRYAVFDKTVAAGYGHVYDTRVSAGVQIALGAHVNDAPPPPLDSDGDGVPDDVDSCPNTPRGMAVDAHGCPLPPPPRPAMAPTPPPPPAPPVDSDHDGVPDAIDQCPYTPAGMQVDAKGCAIKAATIVLHDINFEFNKARLTENSKLSLDQVVAGLKGQPTMQLEIDGYTDSVGKAAYNLKLSKQRAAAARDYLIAQGIEASRLHSEGYGAARPIASNKTRDGRAMNRRVEFKVVQQ